MKLSELEPEFITYLQDGNGAVFWHRAESLAQAQGLRFLCPKCFQAHGGPVGTHSIVIWSRSRGAPSEAKPAPARWAMEGTGFDDLTLAADPPSTLHSIQLRGKCDAHFHVTNGEVIPCP